jgi:hypothetical protein
MQLKIYLTYRPLVGDVKERTSSKTALLDDHSES